MEDDIEYIQGGTVFNAVPGECRVKLRGDEKTKIYAGKEAHASEPHKGVNAISKAMSSLSCDSVNSKLCDFWKEYIGKDFNGGKIGCNISDEVSGNLTFNVGTIKISDGKFKIGVDIRFPVTYDGETIVERIRKRIANSGATLEDIVIKKPLYLPNDHVVIKLLNESYSQYTGDYHTKPIITGGGTYARTLPNIVAFGPVFPGEECTEHQPEEYIYIDDLEKITDIYFDAMLKMSK